MDWVTSRNVLYHPGFNVGWSITFRADQPLEQNPRSPEHHLKAWKDNNATSLSMFGPNLRQPSNPLLHLTAAPAQDTHDSYVSMSEPHVKSLTLDHSSTVDTSDGMRHHAGKLSMGRRSSNCSIVTSPVTFARTLYLIPYSKIRPSTLPMLQAHHRYRRKILCRQSGSGLMCSDRPQAE
jgi:hypothetical protein